MIKTIVYRLLIVWTCTLFCAMQATAATVWAWDPGTNFDFEKQDYEDPTLEDNQDRITDNVWITRGDNQGLYNAENESSFSYGFSPSDTQWADGSATNYESLTFRTWFQWACTDTGDCPLGASGPPDKVNVDAVLHLITDDVYIDIKFLAWTSGSGDPNSNPGGGFSYTRANGLLPTVVPVPAAVYLFASGLIGLAAIARKRIRA